MKKRLILMLIMALMVSQSGFALMLPPVMQVNASFVDVGEIVLYNDRVYVQARALADILGVLTEWDDTTKTAYFYKYERRVVIKEDEVFTYINGHPQGNQGIDTFISSEGRTFLPVRFFSEFFGYNATWDNNLKLVSISAEDVTVPMSMILPVDDAENNLLWLAKIVNIEARGGSMHKKVAVANVVLNRVRSDDYPNTVYDVVKQYGQFPPAYYDYFDTFEPNMHSYVSALHALNGINNVEDCLYFNMVPFDWIPQSRFFGEIEGDYFYR